MNKKPWLTIIGIGDDGWSGLTLRQQNAITAASYIYGGKRHLGFLPENLPAELIPWPSPFSKGVDGILSLKGQNVVALVSGDPMFFGAGATLLRKIPIAEVLVLPHPSSFSLAASYLGWALQDTVCLSINGRPIRSIIGQLQNNKRLIILSENNNSPSELAKLLVDYGFGASEMTVMEHLGGEKQRIRSRKADKFDLNDCENLNLVAVECQADSADAGFSLCSGLPDDAFFTDGQLTKQDVRAVTMAHLAPKFGEVLWDVGAGSGSISIEWLRAARGTRAYAIEKKESRQNTIIKNADHFGVIGLSLIRGEAPFCLDGLESPDAIFIGGGFTHPDLFDRCWKSLKSGGRLVVNAVTLETNAILAEQSKKVNARLIHLAFAEAVPLGNFHVWRNTLPITMMIARKT